MAGSANKILMDLRTRASIVLPEYLARQRWFGGKARSIREVSVRDVVPVVPERIFILFADVRYTEGAKEAYVLLLGSGESRTELSLQDALQERACPDALLQMVSQERRIPGLRGEISAARTTIFDSLCGADATELVPSLMGAEQSNSSIRYGDRLILKVFRRLQEGVNPDLEIGLFLMEQAHFRHVPAVAGSVQYRSKNGKMATLGILQAFVANQGSAWDEALRSTAQFYQQIEAAPFAADLRCSLQRPILDLAQATLSSEATRLAGPFLNTARLLGRRTAELHMALASGSPSDPAFAAEQFTPAFRRTSFASMRKLTANALGLLRDKLQDLPQRWHDSAQRIANAEDVLLSRAKSALSTASSAMRIRIHGDYHLGQVLWTGSDLMIIDFEGEPARTITERQIKRSPLQDVAGMLRSFHYAAFVPLMRPADHGSDLLKAEAAESRANLWWEWMTGAFLRFYLETSGSSGHIPADAAELAGLLDFHLLEKAVYELSYELNNRPEWVGIPLRGISAILGNEV